jgi:hypothetical protein
VTDPSEKIPVTSVGGKPVGRMLPILTFLVGILLGAAVVKPWDLIFPTGPNSGAAASTIAAGGSTPTPGPTPTPDPTSTSAPDECAFAGGWRVFAVGQRDAFGGDGSTDRSAPPGQPTQPTDIGNPLRRWLEIVPLTTTGGPEDPAMPFVTIVSDRIAGLSYCPPPSGDDLPVDTTFTAWRLADDPTDPAAATASQLSLRPATLGPSNSIRIPVYVEDDVASADEVAWVPGRYVFRVGAGDDPSDQRWFGVEIRTPSGRTPG